MMVKVAALVLEEGNEAAIPGVAVANAILAGIAASDAACCAKLKERPRGQSHADATRLLSTVVPHGADMARDLERLLNKTRVELDKTNALQRIELKERQRIAHEVENERRKALGLPPLP